MKLGFDPILTRLVEAASRYPILSPEREREIAIAWHDHGDHAALTNSSAAIFAWS